MFTNESNSTASESERSRHHTGLSEDFFETNVADPRLYRQKLPYTSNTIGPFRTAGRKLRAIESEHKFPARSQWTF